MLDKEALEILNMFATAAQIAKSRNIYEYQYNIQDVLLKELYKRAFPLMANSINFLNITKNM